VGGVQDVPGRAPETIVEAVMAPVVGRDAPGGALVVRELAEALVLRGLGEVQPNLQDKHPVGGEQLFEVADAPQLVVELSEVLGAVDFLAEGFRVPRAGEDTHAAARRQAAPKAPHEWPLAFLIGGRVKRNRFHAARVEPAVEGVDELAAARALDAGDDE